MRENDEKILLNEIRKIRQALESISKSLNKSGTAPNTIMPGTGDITTKVQASEINASTAISEERDIRDVVHDMVHDYFGKED